MNEKSPANDRPNVDIEVTPLVESLIGVVSIPTDLDYKQDYAEFLLEKYSFTPEMAIHRRQTDVEPEG